MLTTSFDSRLYASLYGTEQMKHVWSDSQVVQSWLDTEVALAEVQAEMGLIPIEALTAIREHATLDALDWELMASRTREVGMAIKPMVEQITARGGEWVQRCFHWGATTQDILDTGQALRLKKSLELIEGSLKSLLQWLVELAQEHQLTPMVARTNSQDAAPTSFGLHVSGYAAEMVRHLKRLDEMRPRACMGMLGGAVGHLAAQGAVGLELRDKFIQKLGLSKPAGVWNGSQDGVAEFLNWTGLVHGSLSRMANDVETMGRTAVGELEEGEGSGESSTMPHKTNPRAANMIQTYARLGRMYCGASFDLMDQVDVRSAAMRATAWTVVPEAALVMSASLERAGRLVKHLVVKKERMLRNFCDSKNFVMSEAVMMRLAKEIGRDKAYALIKSVLQGQEASEKSLTEILLASPPVLEHLSEEEIREACEPKNYLGSSTELVGEVVSSAQKFLP